MTRAEQGLMSPPPALPWQTRLPQRIRLREEGILKGIHMEKREEEENGVRYVTYSFSSEREMAFPPVRLHVLIPARGIHYRWTPKLHLVKALNSDWFESLNCSSGFTGAPVECLMTLDNENRALVALSDTLHPIGIKSIPVEENAEYDVEIVLFGKEEYRGTSYEITLRLDLRPLPYYESLQDAALWWETIPGNEPAAVPEAAREIMYSTWYSYHQQVEADTLLEQARLAREFGMESMLLDDGWQTEDYNRGYAYCGDWKPAPSKFPDMAGFVREMHGLGMKVILWYSVPFIGEKSENFAVFRDMLIDPEAKREWHVLDPRYPAVREFLMGLYERALLDWDLDGFKLDFLDEFAVTPFSGKVTDGRRDYASLCEAADRLMKDCMARLKRHKENILLEFRQTYNGPLMRSFGNIFRAVDSPFDDLENHVRITDIRLLAGKSAVHSDMLMWDGEDAPESAAMQFSQILFSVPQISMRLQELSHSHKEMAAYYCKLWKRYQSAFVKGSFTPLNPQCRYNVVMGAFENTLACTYHSRELIVPPAGHSPMVFINGSGREGILLSLSEGGSYRRKVCGCTGRTLQEDTYKAENQILTFPVPPGGTMELMLIR